MSSTKLNATADLIGMDFGTTNSGVSVWNRSTEQIDLLPLDPSNRNAKVARTAIYITNDQKIEIGRGAVERYMEQNTGRPVRMERVWVGEIEVRAEDMMYVTDVYVFADVLSPGRLFLSIKSGLREPDYLGTVVGQYYYPLEDIIALYLSVTKTRTERLLGKECPHVVMGRPVRFAFEPEKDALAQRRLLDAAIRAGYESVHFQQEPVAAAYAYGATLDRPENVLVFDFGGGTLDVTVMHLDGKGNNRILSTGGIPIAGDIFDQKMTRAKLPKHFGEGSHYSTEHKKMPVPSWIYDIFSDWQRILELQNPENLEILDEIGKTAHRPREIAALRTLVGDNYGLQMFDAVEQAKRRLSDDMGTLITFDGPNFNVRQMVTRTEFESIIRQEVRDIDAHIDEMVRQAGLNVDQIDSVVRTGGSAEIPVFRHMLLEKFGKEKVRSIDTFSSVTAGLGICAHHVNEGRLDLKRWTAADLESHALPGANQQTVEVSSVNLKLMQKRIALQEGDVDRSTDPLRMRVLLTNHNRIMVADHAADPDDLVNRFLAGPAEPQWIRALTVGFDEPILFLTNLYRFLLTSPRVLQELAELDMTIQNLHHFRPLEEITAIAPWARIKEGEQFTFVTSRGFARAIKMEQIAGKIESPAPYKFDHAPPGVPVAMFGTSPNDELLVYNDQGRALRYSCRDTRIRYRGVQVINWKDGERVIDASRLAHDGEPDRYLLVTAEGYARLIDPVDVPLVAKHNQRPPLLSARKPVVHLAPLRPALQALTTTGLRPLDVAKLREPDSSTKTERLIKVGKDERLLALL